MRNTPVQAPAHHEVPGDPWHVKQYRLSNGIRLLISPNPDEPRIFTNIAFRAGSKHDPPDTTGLAHYMEHMLFKGGRRIGALDWERERGYLERIADRYEVYRRSSDPAEREALYREIDQLSFEAARLAAPGEYDRLVGALGATATNAYTWFDQTVYVNDIPANELDRWMQLESERFQHLALRLFHTELETVYEEFNISQDQDFRKANNALRAALFPHHPYGTQTTLGRPEHLRNPSMRNIQAFFQRYYVPGNMAIVLAGEVDPEAARDLAERHFGGLAARPVPRFAPGPPPAPAGPRRETVVGKEAPYLLLGWRLGPASGDDPLYATLTEKLLYNQQAGLLDVHLNQNQRVLRAQAFSWNYEDHSVFGLFGRPREGQTLEAVESLLLEQLETLRQGAFEEDLLRAVVNNLRLEEVQDGESNDARVAAMTQTFVLGVDWARYVGRIDWMERLGKSDLVDWVRATLRPDQLVAVYKEQGEDQGVVKVAKPPITPVQPPVEGLSAYGRAFLAQPVPAMPPRFADLEGSVGQHALQPGLRLDYVHNPNNALFRLDYIFDMGKAADRRLALALAYLPYLGTDRYSPPALQEAFYRLGLRYNILTDTYRAYISLQGLDEHLEEGLHLLEHLLHHAVADEGALRKLVEDILIQREHAKKNRRTILHTALAQYGTYGPDSPLRYRLSPAELRAEDPASLVGRLRELSSYEHQVYYFGPRGAESVERVLRHQHRVPAELRSPPERRAFPQLPTGPPRVYLVDFPIVQADLMLLGRGVPHFDLEAFAMSAWYNEYFGSGLSSVVFQEIREKQALAYATWARFTAPARREQSHYLRAYVGTHPDKLAAALPTLQGLIEELPLDERSMEHARRNLLRRLETETTVPRNLYWLARATWDRGYRHDLQRDVYRRIAAAGPRDLLRFHAEHVRDRPRHVLLLGSKASLDRRLLESWGELTELGMEDIFG